MHSVAVFFVLFRLVYQPRCRSLDVELYFHKMSCSDDLSLNRLLLQKGKVSKRNLLGGKLSVELNVIQLEQLFTNVVVFIPIPKYSGQLFKMFPFRQKSSFFSKDIQIRWLLYQQITNAWTDDFSNWFLSQTIARWKIASKASSLLTKNAFSLYCSYHDYC